MADEGAIQERGVGGTGERRLAAILVADVVGYSKLMGRDEAGTLAAVRELCSELVQPKIAEYKGRLFKTTGDGLMVEFPSVVNAVACAVAIQKAMAARNANLPDEKVVQFRIGVNLGDVIAEGDDLFGDGVNVAARLEGLAKPDGVVISGAARDQIGNRLELKFEDMGEQNLKNIERPVRSFKLADRERGTPGVKHSVLVDSQNKVSIAVLPFDNMSGDPEQQYFSDGITEDIITELSRFRMLSVIARNSSFQYRGKATDVRRIGTELGAHYIVEGSVRKMGARVRITAQLIDVEVGSHVWSERFDRAIEQIFDVQDEVTRTIVATVTGRLEQTEISVASRRLTGSMEAYDLFLRGVAVFRSYDDDANTRARQLFEQALTIDPEFAVAHANYASALLAENGYASAPQDIKKEALTHAHLAVRHDPHDSRCHTALGWVYRNFNEFDLALLHTEEALKLNPNDAVALVNMGNVLVAVGRADDAVDAVKKAMALNPYHPEWYWGTLAMSLFATKRYEEALKASAKLGKVKRPWQLARDAACLAQLGRMDEAKAVVGQVLRLQPDFSVSRAMPTYKFEDDARHVRDAMRKAGLPE